MPAVLPMAVLLFDGQLTFAMTLCEDKMSHTAWTGMLVFVLLAALETNTDCDFVRHLHLS